MAKAKVMEFKKIDVMSLAKIFSLFGIILGFVAGIGIAFISNVSIPNMAFPLPAKFGVAAIVAFPIMYGIMYFICGAITALIYNVLAVKIGGIQVTVK
ncbi:hypothetical protein HOD83_00525 [Candidatus Woesearchaeota archaeon]|nr:hypothetical protein [Candidatus Woesearchaeota archaeon]MBT4114288.1 hypothetical protein [Candidatus Woesearchaeota archaeon]MBT4248061.1 hypothetical protein [Candidatus Woesearchaeota archaeon]